MKCRVFFSTLLLLIFNVLFLKAQGGADQPCLNGNDIDNTDCPLDTWVVILALVTVVFTAIYLQRKQKTLKLMAKGF